ncbi:DUF2497 domain-containing protein [Sphingomonas sp.]|uniref:DUF2497 domain-containing protein n=1 Tax=Sphingomonas sp. TaxID=28214 RepID=UPI003B00C635
MGDLSAEPSMEEILSSIKRIIAEEGDSPGPRQRRPVRPGGTAAAPLSAPALAPLPLNVDEADDTAEVLELSDPMPAARPEPMPRFDPSPIEAARPEPRREAPPAASVAPIVSANVAAASRGALDQLSRMVVKAEPGSDGTLEGMVRDMLRPMLSDWLDANLPAMVEDMVAAEIKRITGQQG